jgi:hypothetical protein
MAQVKSGRTMGAAQPVLANNPQSREMMVSYLNLRLGVGLCALVLPPLVYAIGWLNHQPMQSSISAYYHLSEARNWFVAILCSIGIFLFTYRGYPDETKWHQVMGIAAIGVGMIRTTLPGSKGDVLSYIHLFCACMLFGCMGVMAYHFFPRNQGQTKMTKRHRDFNSRIYRGCGRTIAAVGGIYGLWSLYKALTPFEEPADNWLFGVEFVCIYAFGTAWLLKSHLLYKWLKKLKINPFDEPKPLTVKP